ncbi:hypothetical protein NQ318_023302 [Aromia moschata]|uniref:Reverse transcriptase zinc-binding domain-containing protein n=1 Tax=Aromia moschata TaxID=1265417 RepID=A0AAV8XRN7_9CUCU|nr:hypothetical protein NQ318_023302 [Aromia moschata]
MDSRTVYSPLMRHLTTIRVKNDPDCKRCGEQEETFHILFECPALAAIRYSNFGSITIEPKEKNCDNETTQNNNLEQSHEENKENVHLNPICVLTSNDIQTSPIIEPIDLSSDQERNDVTLEEKKASSYR